MSQLDPDYSWFNDARCRGMDAAIFFSGCGPDNLKAKAICHQCEVATECLEYALKQGPTTPGIWGGTNSKDRRRIVRLRRKESNARRDSER